LASYSEAKVIAALKTAEAKVESRSAVASLSGNAA
jgi:hypothetical protein